MTGITSQHYGLSGLVFWTDSRTFVVDVKIFLVNAGIADAKNESRRRFPSGGFAMFVELVAAYGTAMTS
jgi:hypothetical protein